MYTWSSRIRFSETGEDQRLTLDGIVDYFQDSSTFQSEDLGNGINVLKDLGRAWVLSSWQIVVEEYPKFGEMVTLGTWPYEFSHFLGVRNFIMHGEDGRVLAYANSLWTYLNTDSGRPARVDEQVLKLYELEPKYSMEYADRKIGLPEKMEAQPEFFVQPYHLDANHHVNNGQYLRIAGSYLPEGFVTAQVRAEYKKQAVLGDRICPKVHMEENRIIVSLEDAQGNAFAVAEFLRTAV